MANKRPIEIFMPPNVLKAKMGNGSLDLSAVERAEQALEDLKGEFAGWMSQDVSRLVDAGVAYAHVDGSSLYFIHYVSPKDPTRYLVQAYDVQRGRLLAKPITSNGSIDRSTPPAMATSRSNARTTQCLRSISPARCGCAGTRGWCGSSMNEPPPM